MRSALPSSWLLIAVAFHVCAGSDDEADKRVYPTDPLHLRLDNLTAEDEKMMADAEANANKNQTPAKAHKYDPMGVSSEDAADNPTSTPFLMYCRRTLRAGAVDQYKSAFRDFGKLVMTIPGMKAAFAFMDKQIPLLQSHEIYWFNSMSVFDAQKDVPTLPGLLDAVRQHYNGKAAENACQIFGNDTAALSQMVVPDGEKHVVVPLLEGGFLRPYAWGLAGSPVIVITRRTAQADKMPQVESAMKEVCVYNVIIVQRSPWHMRAHTNT